MPPAQSSLGAQSPDRSAGMNGDSDDRTIRMASPGETVSAPEDEIERMALQLAAGRQDPSSARQAVATMTMPAVATKQSSGPKPVVIKGGPRRVVRADGRAPQLGTPIGQKHFSLSSGHEMFRRPRRISRVTASVIGVICITLVIAIIEIAWTWSNVSARTREQEQLVDTSIYDTSLSLTPAVDGGYYTVFFITSTPTNENQIGTLQQILMYRTPERPDRSSFSSAVRVSVPTDLAVSVTSSDGTSSTASISDVLASTGVTRALTGIDSAFGLRCYNVVVIGTDYFDQIEGLLTGKLSASDVDADSLLGHVRSNLSLQGIVDYAAKIGAAEGENIASFVAPTNEVTTTSGVTLSAGSSEQYLEALNSVLANDSAQADSEATTSTEAATATDAAAEGGDAGTQS
jgi:hypothetical protein